MIETLARAVCAATSIIPRPPVAPSSYVEKVLAGYCWREHCRNPESSSTGLCAEHLEEARNW